MRKASKGMKYTRHKGGVCSLRSADRCKDIEIIIPEQVLFKGKVIKIDEYAFSNLSFITKVVIPEGVVSIGESAFAGCDSLGDVAISDALKEVHATSFVAANIIRIVYNGKTA